MSVSPQHWIEAKYEKYLSWVNLRLCELKRVWIGMNSFPIHEFRTIYTAEMKLNKEGEHLSWNLTCDWTVISVLYMTTLHMGMLYTAMLYIAMFKTAMFETATFKTALDSSLFNFSMLFEPVLLLFLFPYRLLL